MIDILGNVSLVLREFLRLDEDVEVELTSDNAEKFFRIENWEKGGGIKYKIYTIRNKFTLIRRLYNLILQIWSMKWKNDETSPSPSISKMSSAFEIARDIHVYS